MKPDDTRYLIGIDDTDNLESRGTGFRARSLGEFLASNQLATVTGITRHQLLVDARIPYTSHNSSACLTVEADPAGLDDLAEACRRFLLRESAPGSDAGLCIAAWYAAQGLHEFGERAKREVVTQADALVVARQTGALLEGLTGTGGGLIGACAGAGLRAGGNDGRFLWLPGLRELSGTYSAAALYQAARIEAVHDLSGVAVPPSDGVEIGPWARPALRDGRAVLWVEPAETGLAHGWRVAAKEIIKQRTE